MVNALAAAVKLRVIQLFVMHATVALHAHVAAHHSPYLMPVPIRRPLSTEGVVRKKQETAMKTILAAFMALGLVFSTGVLVAGSAHASNLYVPNSTTVTGNAAG
jgi:hypothetical protein